MSGIFRNPTSIFRRPTRGEGSRRSSRQPNYLQMIEDAGYGYVEFVGTAQQKRFVELLSCPMTATRFINQDTLQTLGLKKPLKRMLRRAGCPGLYRIKEQTYRCLTLEFLSSYFYDEEEGTVNFRLFNCDKSLSLEEWGETLGCRSVGCNYFSDFPDSTGILWRALTGLNREGSSWKFRLHLIHHPVIRLWCRLVGNTYFGRPESTNMKIHEVAMLASYLNVHRGEPFQVNIAHYVAEHFEMVATGEINPILIGGFATHLAKKVFDDVNEENLELLPGDSIADPPTMDLAYLGRLRYIKANGPRTWWWKVGTTELMQLPVDEENNCLRPVLSLQQDSNAPVDYQYYLLPATDRYGGTPIGGGADAGPSVNLIPPLGDYSRFQHYPFHQGPYQPAGYDPAQFPPTFATYPPFVEPRVWNQNTRDSMLLGLCNQMHQVNLDRSLGDHNIYAYHAGSGHFPAGTQHPAYYVPAVDQNEADNAAAVQNDPQDFQTDRSDTEATDGYRHFTNRYVVQDSDDDQVDYDDVVEAESETIATDSEGDAEESYAEVEAESEAIADDNDSDEENTGYVVEDSDDEVADSEDGSPGSPSF